MNGDYVAAVVNLALLAVAIAGAFVLGWISSDMQGALGPDMPLDQPDSWEGRTTLQPSAFFLPERMEAEVWRGANFTTLQIGDGTTAVRITYPGRNVSFMPPPPEGRCCGSMYPAVSNRSTLIVTPARREEIAIGDIIAFHCTNHTYLLHRVIAVTQTEDDTFYLTKGDNNRVDDLAGFGCMPSFANVSHKLAGILY